jgi:2-hydroxychromene-2-carboxylate isomerase
MSKLVTYYFTPVSPWAYLGHQRFLDIARAAGAAIAYRPVDYGRVFPVSGGLPLKQRPPQRQAYRLFELKRWSTHLGLPLTIHPKHFPVPANPAAHLIIAADLAGHDPGPLVGALLRAVWAEERDVSTPATLVEIANEVGLDGAALLEAANGTTVLTAYDAYTEDAIAAQVFGAPTYVYRDEPFWGQDRLDFLERALG